MAGNAWGDHKYNRRDDIAIYDGLPPEVRKALRSAPIHISTADCEALFDQGHFVDEVMNAIKFTSQKASRMTYPTGAYHG